MFNKLKGFTRAFWTANFVELLERGAYYGVFIVITLYLSKILGFTDVEAALISGIFSGGLYLLPTFSGAYADKIGFKNSLLIAFTLLTLGYFGLGILPGTLESAGLVSYEGEIKFTGLNESVYRWSIVPILLVLMIGGSFIKSVITGTVAKETTEDNRAQGFSIFYMMVNIGAFSGKAFVKPFRDSLGDIGLIYFNFFSAGLTFIALLLIIFVFKTQQHQGEGKSLKQIWVSFIKVLTNGRLVTLILIITGFWMVQQQLYATMPKYVTRLAGEDSAIGWYANVNPFVVFTTVAFITSLMAKKTPLFSMTVGMFLMPISALVMASGNFFDGSNNFNILGMEMHPIAVMMILGIAVQGLAESFISPRYLQFFSLQAPKGEEGLYLGFSHLHSFLSSVIGFGLSGFLLSKYCPDPKLFETREAFEAAAVNAHYIWYVFAGIALLSAISLIIYGKVIARLDAKTVN